MDRRSWPWKKKSSDKTVTSTDNNSSSLASSGNAKTDQDDTKTIKYVQISVESYAHLTNLEDQVKMLNEKVSDLNGKLSSAQSEMITKDSLVKQHAKVAEEAVSGWEKAEAEALTLKQQLESVTLLKLTVEDRASHLDGALKECMKQVRSVKEEGEQKLHDVVFAKTKQWEKAKAELEAKIIGSEQELLKSSAEIAALSRTLQERSNMLMKISDEKSQADAEIEVMKNDIQSCEREINSLKYELHVVAKELEIRNEEKNMSMRSAEVANKQHLEDVKKITKLEAECQRLRGLVRKKLPGPAALAQMKLEVESLGRDYGETRLRRSPARSSSPHHVSPSDFALENMHQCRKENEFLTARLLTMEEEMKMLKEALSKRNSELQASRNMCAKTSNKLRSIESHLLVMNQQKSPTKSITEIPVEIESKPPSLTSMSEDGIDDEGSCSESWATALMSELSQFKKEKNVDSSKKSENSNQLELMDDFLEMERLACQSTEANGSITVSDGATDNLKTEPVDVSKHEDGSEQITVELPKTLVSSNTDQPAHESSSHKYGSTLSKLQSRMATLFESQSQSADMEKLLEDIKRIVQNTHEELPQNLVDCVASETHSTNSCIQKEHDERTEEVKDSGAMTKQEAKHVMVQELKDAILQIHDFVLSIGKEAKTSRPSDDRELTERIEKFSASVDKVLCDKESVTDFLLALSNIFSKKDLLNYVMPSYKCNEGESYNSDCIDKVTLLENKVALHEHEKEKFSGGCMLDTHSSSDPDIEGHNLSCELKITPQACSLEEFEQLKLQKESVETDFAKCKETLELTNHQLVGMKQLLSEIKLQLAASEKSNSLAETQLKCMAESYKTLESQKQELETELNLVRTKLEVLEAELQEEKNSHQDDLAKYKELQDQMERNSKSTVDTDADVDTQTQQEREIAAAAEKLAECQETIFLLGRQLNSLRPPSESLGSSSNSRQPMSDGVLEDEPSADGFTIRQATLSPQHFDQFEIENITTSVALSTGGESPLNGYNSYMSLPDTESGPFPKSPLESRHQKHKVTRSSSSSSSAEKHGRGFSRFFSKGRSEH
ncbi:uncharacterized protein A4U43_C04F10990 [Asparagus officinalis]|uniref:Filament-like plant protein 4 n=1 Tax=Asparagus officinalis TaxID=4686 RepID=A0A5P1F2M8_ASPOF|nr:uncharacterized protein A4U43_C04F10990 [Asparagus officinalis]